MISLPPSDLLFAQVREDPQVDLEVARRVAERRGRPVRVLLVASGGCTAVSLLGAPEIAEVHAIDVNPAQLHLTSLRQQAALRLEPAELRIILGDGDETRRLALYRSLRDSLPAEARAHWDAREPEVRIGVNRAGRFEELFRELGRELASHGIDAAADPAAASRPGWAPSFQRVFERARLAHVFGEAAVAYSMDRSFADHFQAVFAAALARYPVADNYFLHQALCDRYGADEPPYFAPDFRARAARLGGDRLHLHQGRFAERLQEVASQPFDVIQTSNISDWMPRQELGELLARVRACLAPGGAIVARRLNGDHVLQDLVGQHFSVDRTLSERLLAADRSFFYREVVVGFSSGPPT